jgi:hypothetical protein
MSNTGATGPPEQKVNELLSLPMGLTDATVPQCTVTIIILMSIHASPAIILLRIMNTSL